MILLLIPHAFAACPDALARYPDADAAGRVEAASCALSMNYPHAAVAAASSAVDDPGAWAVLDGASLLLADDSALVALAEGRDRAAFPPGVTARLDYADGGRALAEGRYADAIDAWQRVPGTSPLYVDAQYRIGVAGLADEHNKTAAKGFKEVWDYRVAEPPAASFPIDARQRISTLQDEAGLGIAWVYAKVEPVRTGDFTALIRPQSLCEAETFLLDAAGALATGDEHRVRQDAKRLARLPLHAWAATGVLLQVDLHGDAVHAHKVLDPWADAVQVHLDVADAFLAAHEADATGGGPLLPQEWRADVMTDDRVGRAATERLVLEGELRALAAWPEAPPWLVQAVTAADAATQQRLDTTSLAALRDRRVTLAKARERVEGWQAGVLPRLDAGEAVVLSPSDLVLPWEDAHLGP